MIGGDSDFIVKIFSNQVIFRSSPPEVFLKKGVLKICIKFYWRTPMSKCDFNKVALQL